MGFDAIILAGGRSSRLGGVPKAALAYRGRSLLESTLDAASAARRIVVVGPIGPARLPSEVVTAREEPPFSGPAAAIAAGLHALTATEEDDFTLVLACDMPRVADAVTALSHQLPTLPTTVDGVIAVDASGRLQPLVAAYRTSTLRALVAENERAGSLEGLPARRYSDAMELRRIRIPEGATDDVDTWDDAERLGIERGKE